MQAKSGKATNGPPRLLPGVLLLVKHTFSIVQDAKGGCHSTVQRGTERNRQEPPATGHCRDAIGTLSTRVEGPWSWTIAFTKLPEPDVYA